MQKTNQHCDEPSRHILKKVNIFGAVKVRYGGTKREMLESVWNSASALLTSVCRSRNASSSRTWTNRSREFGRLVVFCRPSGEIKETNKASRQRRWLMCSFNQAKRRESWQGCFRVRIAVHRGTRQRC